MTAWLTLTVLVLLLIYTSVRRVSGLLATCPSWSENILQLSSEQLRMSIYLISIYEQSLSASPRRSSTVGKGHQLDCEEAPTNFGHLIFSLPNFISYSSETPSPLLLMLIRATENPSDRASVYQGMPLAARVSPARDLLWQDWSQHPEPAICSSVPEPQDCAFSPLNTAGEAVSISLSSALCKSPSLLLSFLARNNIGERSQFLAGMAVCCMLDSHLHIHTCMNLHTYTYTYTYVLTHTDMYAFVHRSGTPPRCRGSNLPFESN